MLDSRAPNWLARHSSAAQLREPSGVLAPFLTFAKRIQHMLNESAYLAMIRRQIDLESSGPHDEFRNWFNGRDSNLISQMAAVCAESAPSPRSPQAQPKLLTGRFLVHPLRPRAQCLRLASPGQAAQAPGGQAGQESRLSVSALTRACINSGITLLRRSIETR